MLGSSLLSWAPAGGIQSLLHPSPKTRTISETEPTLTPLSSPCLPSRCGPKRQAFLLKPASVSPVRLRLPRGGPDVPRRAGLLDPLRCEVLLTAAVTAAIHIENATAAVRGLFPSVGSTPPRHCRLCPLVVSWFLCSSTVRPSWTQVCWLQHTDGVHAIYHI